MKVTQVLTRPDMGMQSPCIIRIAVPFVSERGVKTRIQQRMEKIDGWGAITTKQKGNNIVVDVPQILAHKTEFGALVVSLAVLERTS